MSFVQIIEMRSENDEQLQASGDVSGRMHLVHDGTKSNAGAADAYLIEPGHDAWVVGDEPMVGCEFESTTAQTDAKST